MTEAGMTQGRRGKPAVTLPEITLKDIEGNTVVYDREMIEVLKNTVAKKATDPELYMFLSLANRWGLDPFAKEIWFIKFTKRGKVETRVETSRDGYLAIAKRDPEYMGVHSDVVHENDTFQVVRNMGEVTAIIHEYSATERGAIVGGWAIAKHASKDMAYVYLPFNEANQGSPIWDSHPSAMMKKVVESFVLKRIAGITGLITAEEMGTDVDKIPDPSEKQNSPKRQPRVTPEEEEDFIEAEFEEKTDGEQTTIG